MPRTPDGGWDLDDTVPSFAGIKKSQAKGGFKFKPVQVTDESLDAYEKERLAGLEKLAKVAPVGVKGPKWVPPKLNDDGSLVEG